MERELAREIVISAHEASHAVAAVRVGIPFEYVTLDDETVGPHVQPLDSTPRPIPFYEGGSCCDVAARFGRSSPTRLSARLRSPHRSSFDSAGAAGRPSGHAHEARGNVSVVSVRGTSVDATGAAGVASSVRASTRRAARQVFARNPDCRMRTKPRGRMCWTKRRRNSIADSVIVDGRFSRA